ncbi:hypothetical protein SUGI_0677580 [Cryptomeria japonica]|nr:hypothetical protein SUGI_0677580 [Cryptomeria japonica]
MGLMNVCFLQTKDVFGLPVIILLQLLSVAVGIATAKIMRSNILESAAAISGGSSASSSSSVSQTWNCSLDRSEATAAVL